MGHFDAKAKRVIFRPVQRRDFEHADIIKCFQFGIETLVVPDNIEHAFLHVILTVQPSLDDLDARTCGRVGLIADQGAKPDLACFAYCRNVSTI